MFAKLKQKIAEEESTSDSSRSLPSSPSVRRAKVNGWTENKWERRRLSNASSLYESRESLLSESSTVSSGLNVSRHASFTSRSAATPVGTPIEPPGFSVNSRSSKEEILHLLAKKGDQVSKLEAKIADMASLLREQTRVKESLEGALEKQKEEHSMRLRSMNMEFEEKSRKMKNEFEKTLDEKNQELESKLKELTLESTRYADLNELNQLQQQELTKMKSLFIQYQTDATRKAAEIFEKSKQIEDLDKSYLEQKGELASLQERLDDLARERTKFESRDKQQQARVTSLEREKTSLCDELKNTVNELTQKSVQLDRVEKSLRLKDEELANLRQTHALYKNKVSMELEQNEGEIAQLKERVGDLQQRVDDSKLSGNDQVQAIEKEREQLENRLRETRDQLNELKANSNDRTNTLGSLVSTLNERLERKESELTECKRRYDQDYESWKSQNFQLEQELAILKEESLSGKRSSDRQTASLEGQVIRLEAAREKEKSEMQTKLDQLKMIENEYSRQEDAYKQQIADLEEEKEQLQNELLSKAEENRQVSLCLEDAMRETNELKSQIAKFEETLKEKNNLLTCFKESKLDSPSHVVSNLGPEALENLKEELNNTKDRYQNAEEVLKQREKTISELRKAVAEKEELLNRSTTKIRQYEENNRYIGNDRIYSPESRDSHKLITNLRERVKELEEQLQEREMLLLDENELRDLRKDNNRLEKDLEDKDKKIKLLQAKNIELKKAFQRELKMAAPGGEPVQRSPGTPNGDVIVHSDEEKERQDYLEVNFKYLKHVVLKYMCSTNKQSRQLINVIGHLLRFTPKEHACVREAMEWKLPLD
ncbi:golgin subfamily A member 1-like isoform X1 [Pocillopora damicornis]|uniref:golgin subfamily A member 1-like isoform X1 n=1 Tax=Pocillopora damicornis TaxID=46731 RepID=UPI000F54E54A|nr:golgin subfamily A member 1-like isoform X1 [Pocillopora damicornis]